MYNEVHIGKKVVPMLAMASVDVYYKNIFKEDAIKLQSSDSFDTGELIGFVQRMGFVMAKFAELKDHREMKKLNEDMFLEWLDQFDRIDYMNALADIRLTYEGQMITDSDAKKKDEEPSDK